MSTKRQQWRTAMTAWQRRRGREKGINDNGNGRGCDVEVKQVRSTAKTAIETATATTATMQYQQLNARHNGSRLRSLLQRRDGYDCGQHWSTQGQIQRLMDGEQWRLTGAAEKSTKRPRGYNNMRPSDFRDYYEASVFEK
mmetsp:Transcript_28178/g.51499  ORF Transcript_28178/g.51499 Transcript_28178/m.51499 type:complete len:140 (-) Transcript_28178:774-1193(-)